MIFSGATSCPNCGGTLKLYDRVYRLVRTKGGMAEYAKVRRWKCLGCNSVHREIPNDIYPYKQYESEIIKGVLDGLITSNTIGFEDYPCEMTMKRWRTRN